MKTLFEEKAVPSAHPDFVLRELDGEIFLAHVSGRRVRTDRLGKAVWESLPGKPADIVERVRREWNVSPGLIRQFLYLLLRAGAVTSPEEAADAPSPRQADETPAASTASVIVITRNGQEHIRGCLSSLAAQTSAPLEVLVVDNASTDRTAGIVSRDFPWARLLSLKRNIYFPGAVNRGLAEARGRFLMVLNDDTELDPDCLRRLCLKMASRPRAGAVAPMMKFYHLRGFINGLGNHIRAQGWGSDNFIGCVDVGQFAGLAEVPSACFGAVLLRREAVVEVGGLDAAYVAYYEDVDWSFRAWLRGWAVVPEPAAVVYHKFGAFWKTQARKQAHVVRNRQRLVLKLFEEKTRRSYLRSYAKEDVKGFLHYLGRKEFGLAAVYPRAYAALLCGLPGILLARQEILKGKAPGSGAEAVLQKNPGFFSCLDDSQSPRLDAATVFEYYRWEPPPTSSPESP
jgi:GT2 family glycosyltransferase